MMMNSSAISTVAELFAERLALCLVGGALISAVVWIVLRCSNFSSRTRYLVWWTAFISSTLLLLPQFSFHRVAGSVSSVAPLMLPESWAVYVFALWSVGVAIGIVRLGAGALRVRRLRRSCSPVDIKTVAPELKSVLEEIAGSRDVAICTSSSITVPSVLGFFRPVVVVPADLMDRLTAAELKHVLIHELAHLKYWDDWANLAQKVLRAVLFFHPAAWWIDHELSAERELACDDFVVLQTGDSKAYARCLASLAEISFVRRTAALVNAVLGRGGQTSARVGRLLQLNAPATNRVFRPVVSVAVIVFVAAFSIRAYTPTLVGFQDTPETATADTHFARLTNPGRGSKVPVQLASYHVPRGEQMTSGLPTPTNSAYTRKIAQAHPSRMFQASKVALKQPHVLNAKANAATAPRFRVEQAYFAVVNGGADGTGSVAFYQVTVWQLAPAKSPKTVDHKIT